MGQSDASRESAHLSQIDSLMRAADTAHSEQRYKEAITLCGEILSRDPEFLPARILTAVLHLKTGHLDAAEHKFLQILKSEPRNFASLLWLGTIYSRHGRAKEAVPLAKRAVQLKPEDLDAQLLLARALFEEGSLDESETETKKALAIKEPISDAQAMLGTILQQRGKMVEAESHLLRAIEIEPTLGPPYYDLVQGRKITESDRDLLKSMEQLVASSKTPARDRSRMHYALGKSYNDLHEYGNAMENFDKANEIALIGMLQGRPPFNRKSSRDDMSRAALASEWWRKSPQGSASQIPTLIVGMMRSGTTLVEQIVSSHSQVGSAGEQSFWLDRSGEFQLAGAAPSPKEAAQLANEYLELLSRFGAGKERVTEKNPHNFITLGTFRSVFPNGRIIHCRRKLIDSSLSIYMTPFRVSPDFGHSKENIVFFAHQYAKLMEHWRQVMPSENFMEVDYEDLVTDQETVTRKMIDFVGLEWEDSCLDFAKNRRNVSTPSLWQVRQPIYRSSLDRWRNYEPWLGAFSELIHAGN